MSLLETRTATESPGAGGHDTEGSYVSSGRMRAISWGIVFALGLLQAWSHRLDVGQDGVEYLDVAENYARGAWGAAINGYLSPLYSWLLALGMWGLGISRRSESVFLHAINFAGYLGAYGCCLFLLREFRGLVQTKPVEQGAGDLPANPFWQVLALGLFLYSSLHMTSVAGATPDILVALFAYLATALVLRILSNRATWLTAASLGVALGLGYFAKTAMFPLSLLCLGATGIYVFFH